MFGGFNTAVSGAEKARLKGKLKARKMPCRSSSRTSTMAQEQHTSSNWRKRKSTSSMAKALSLSGEGNHRDHSISGTRYKLVKAQVRKRTYIVFPRTCFDRRKRMLVHIVFGNHVPDPRLLHRSDRERDAIAVHKRLVCR
jgi:hypothetical protein